MPKQQPRPWIKMPHTPSKALRWALAILVGLPGTIMFVPLAALFAHAGISSFIDALRGAPWAYSPPPTLASGLLTASWGIAGFCGIVGFWLWVLQLRWVRTPNGHRTVTACVCLGVGAMLPFAVALVSGPTQTSAWSLFSIAGVVAGVVVLYLQFRRTKPPGPGGPASQESESG